MSGSQTARCGGSGRLTMSAMPGNRPDDVACPGCPDCSPEADEQVGVPDPEPRQSEDRHKRAIVYPHMAEPRQSVADEREEGEKCQSCGRRYEAVWAADDAMWNEVVGGPNGLRCPECFDREARAAGFRPYWFADDRHFPSPERAREAASEATTLRTERDNWKACFDAASEARTRLAKMHQAAEKRAEEFAARAVAATEDAIDQNQARSSAEAEVARLRKAIKHEIETDGIGRYWLWDSEQPGHVVARLREALEPPPPDTQ